MAGITIDPRDRTTILVHYYRAMVGRADMWRTRMDATTNWAIGATAAVISFALGNESVPHYVVFIASLLTGSFLLLEARRLTFYHLWQQRVLLLESGLIRPAVASMSADGHREAEVAPAIDLAEALQSHLGRTAPNMPLRIAVARRLRRVYLYLFAVQFMAWGFKLSNHPAAAGSSSELVAHADIGSLPGAVVIALAAIVFFAGAAFAALQGGVDRR